ncbi:putative zinc protease AlbF [Novipirellula galeiformis]|uniref:Putative zinc protease AlbF n=1 Tax=Novipirellula galeiformis TaxID=2528004 RepID=A0A5C6CHA1_9BACT|nr:pitrilysin family protein [Novipirellula galeiformis]TWU23405.1 putative zinc protease AlbF [Novipirellula galeiformis]
MIDFELIAGPFDVPIYFQRLPVNTVSLNWLVFVGSADDDQAGGHGIYHWFEHVPSRGTKKFPGGYRDTEARLVRHGGGSDAETGSTHTSFSAASPKRVWAESLEILADMVGQPLLRVSDIEAERDIILQEINEWHSDPYHHSLCRLPGVLWPDHPLGHDQLGTAKQLKAIDARQLRHAHASGYSRNRSALFIAGDIERNQLIEVVQSCLEQMPGTPLSPRKHPAHYGPLPAWQADHVTTIDSPHADSIVYLLFPIPPTTDGIEAHLQWDFLEDVFSAGELGSPLNRLVREDSRLAYSPEFISTTYPDGGYAGLVAQTSVEPELVLEAFWRLIQSPEIRSAAWLDYVRDTIRGGIEMHDPNACEYTDEGSATLIHYGRCLTDSEYSSKMLSYSDRDVAEWMERLVPSASHAIVFRGHGEHE